MCALVALVGLANGAHAAAPSKDLSVIYPPLSSADRPSFAVSSAKPITGFVAAPMPNQNAIAPHIVAAPGPEVSPSMFRANRGYRGDGFTPDSSPQIAQQSKRLSMPGISVKVPLY